MKKLPKYLAYFSSILLFTSCTIEPVDIEYNVDQCHACKMTIADSRFGSELVTTKGKVYKYDAIECLVPALLEKGESHYKYVMVTNFNEPRQLIDARNCYYLISKELPSPMGGYLSAHPSKEAADAASAIHGGQVLSWESLKNQK